MRFGVPLIGLAHGSRHPGVGAAVDALLAAVAGTEGVATRAAYLDLTAPDLSTVAAELAAEGHRSAVVVPLLFTSAFHATVDVPEAIAEAAAASGLQLLRADILGTGPDLEQILSDSLTDSLTDSLGEAPGDRDAAVLLYAVGSSDPEANAAVQGLADRLGRRRGQRVRAGFGTAEPRAAAVLAELLADPVGDLGEPGRGGAADRVVVLPLFLAPGLLLDSMAARAAESGVPVLAPLAERAAPVLARRYRERAGRADGQDRTGHPGRLG